MPTFDIRHSTFVLSSPAKINLYLEVGPKRADGFHSLRTLMARLALADTIKFEDKGDGFELVLRFAQGYPRACRRLLTTDMKNNLVARAWQLLAGRFPQIRSRRIRITLTKTVPAGAGLGGGSSNAATALIGIRHFFSLAIRPPELVKLGSLLGSDVPFFLKSSCFLFPSSGPLWWATGRGEWLCQAGGCFKTPLLIVYPGFGAGTKEAYDDLDRRGQNKTDWLTREDILPTLLKEVSSIGRRLSGFKSETIKRSAAGFNSFEEMALAKQPVLKKLKAELVSMMPAVAAMTGSGSCFYAVGSSPRRIRRWTGALASKAGRGNFAYYITTIE
ncbi:MAG: 4-(cytidine 5'-diphospho)-2-C-methyl-D-erythritol kinase [Elusimicrobia bacterium]|nr:4-(cytidine 5'-diphospho)-2-C-methyl-D-erythritol kinase [Elusimicrobiota bacterium]